MFCHVQGAVPHELLEHKRIAAAVQKILSGESVSELVDRGAFDSSVFVVPFRCFARGR